MPSSDGMPPKSRVNLTYNTRQPEQLPKEKELPFRLLVLGDLSGRKWKDPAAKPSNGTPDDLEHRPTYNLNGRNLDAVLEKMNVSLTLKDVANHVDATPASFDVTIPIQSLQAFEPGQIVGLLKPAERMLELKKLVLDLQQNLNNKKEFRLLMRKVTSDRALRDALKAKFEQTAKSALTIPTP